MATGRSVAIFLQPTSPMKTKHHIVTANQAVAQIAFKTNEVFPIYPITPASDMSELVEQFSAQKKTNIFNTTPEVFEMQSEGGVAGAMHGALQTGSLSSTFTASQGLLLMLPNMYKIAGELTPNVIHVATRSIATHALSVFGDHSDIMAVRQSGYAMLGSASVQEAQDFALIAQAATLKSKIPFIHFFDGFRTSHETSKIETIPDSVIKAIIREKDINTHRKRALNPNAPVIRGTSQGPDVFFQSREAQNTFYNNCPEIVQEAMNNFARLTGRQYHTFDYVGHPEAKHIIISMASSTETIETTLQQLNKQGQKLGLVKVRLFRPFNTEHLIKALPQTVRSIAVLDRTKEPGSSGEPLYLDVLRSINTTNAQNNFFKQPIVVGGRYGLSSKEFTPSMVNAIFNNLKQENPKNNFTIGIQDDVTNLSLDYSKTIHLKNNDFKALFYQTKNNETTKSFSNTLQLIAENTYIQGYTERDYKKSNSREVSHLRVSEIPIKAPYLIELADFTACDDFNFLREDNILQTIKSKGTLLVNTSKTSKAFWKSLPANIQYQITEKELNLYIVNLEETQGTYTINGLKLNTLNACLFALKDNLYNNKNLNALKDYIYKVDISSYKKEEVTAELDTDFSTSLLGMLLANKGDSIPVSLLPVDGTFETNTSELQTIKTSKFIPKWDPEACTQCGACSMACPQSSLRIKAFSNDYIKNAPQPFSYTDSKDFDLLNYTIKINPSQCTSCNNCVDSCSSNALSMTNISASRDQKNWDFFKTIPELDRALIDTTKVSEQQLQEPLFKYSSGVEGCGEAPYLKLVSQLFGERLLVANATGASSIFGGALPTTPWAKTRNGKGPAWSNSLFEDNAEFGLGYRLSLDQQKQQAKMLLKELTPFLNFDLVHDILSANQETETEINEQHKRIELLKDCLTSINHPSSTRLNSIVDALVKKSVWIIGGDGWAYDIGFGGLDHVIASGKNVNILVLDNEVYDNTGGQASKATPFGASAKFAFTGKQKQKKDLGRLAMTYDNVYVASVAIGANQEQTLKAFNEAESFDGPSVIIAYTHSKSHGIDMKNPSQYHKAAVNSGQWILYRNDPRKTQNFQLDSDFPSIAIEEYLKLERRFSKLFNQRDANLKAQLKQYQDYINNRFNWFKNLSHATYKHA